MQLSNSQLKYLEERKVSLQDQMKRVRTAVTVSRPFEEWKTDRTLNARQSIKLIFWITANDIPYWETERLYTTMAQKAYMAQYEGLWSKVQAMLELETQDFISMTKYFLEHIGTFNDLSNYLTGKGVTLKPKYYDSVLDKRPVRYPQRKRGYDDKGSRRLPHEYHGEDLVSPDTREREDRRKHIAHPLVREKFKTPQENRDRNSASEKKGEFNDERRESRPAKQQRSEENI